MALNVFEIEYLALCTGKLDDRHAVVVTIRNPDVSLTPVNLAMPLAAADRLAGELQRAVIRLKVKTSIGKRASSEQA